MSEPHEGVETVSVALGAVDRVRLLCAFQVISFPSGFRFRGVTRQRGFEVIESLLGIRLKETATPPRATRETRLDDYIAWASQPDVQLPNA